MTEETTEQINKPITEQTAAPGCCGGASVSAAAANGADTAAVQSCCGSAGATAVGGDLKEQIRERYAERAREVVEEKRPATCGCGCAPADVVPNDELARGLYEVDEMSELPPEAVLASLGCGNPTALAELHEGEVVLDLGSGGGIDVLLSAKRVGPTGKAYGLDMTDEMLALARANQRKAGVTNVEFLKGEIENVPLPDASVDVIISNCVINLSLDKDKVLAEAFRVLKPGGRFAVSDMVFRGDLRLVPDEIMRSVEAWGGCIAGALEERDYVARLERAGFADAEVVVTRDYGDEYGKDVEQACGVPLPEGVTLVGAFVRATKPSD
jgi:arsenite methyltransferase